MIWQKLGIVWNPHAKIDWATNSALTPTPFDMGDGRIRVYAGFRDDEGVSRIGWVDVDERDPMRILDFSRTPALGRGRAGCFDDNGVIMGDVVRMEGAIRLYYIGFQLVRRAKFLAFTGLAVSTDDGNSFIRESECPILDRGPGGEFVRAIHSVSEFGSGFRFWCGEGNEWENIGGADFPSYAITSVDSMNGIDFPRRSSVALGKRAGEYRLGRPRVFKNDDQWYMFFTSGTVAGEYQAGYAVSSDGTNWERRDDIGLVPSPGSFDSRWVSYVAPIRTRHNEVLGFYNGDGMGRDGFACARLIQW